MNCLECYIKNQFVSNLQLNHEKIEELLQNDYQREIKTCVSDKYPKAYFSGLNNLQKNNYFSSDAVEIWEKMSTSSKRQTTQIALQTLQNKFSKPCLQLIFLPTFSVK